MEGRCRGGGGRGMCHTLISSLLLLSVAAGLLVAAAAAGGGAGLARRELGETSRQTAALAANPPPSYSLCGPDTGEMTAASGVVTDGSGPGGEYLPDTNCTWVIRPALPAGGFDGAGGGASLRLSPPCCSSEKAEPEVPLVHFSA